MSNLRSISAVEFEEWRPSLRVIAHEHARRFAALRLQEGEEDAAISWRSDLIEPVIKAFASHVWIGVDQRVACLSSRGTFMFAAGLGSSLLSIEPLPAFVAILCETELLAVNPDYSVRAICSLRDIPDRIELQDGEVVVTLVDGARQTLRGL